MQSEFLEYNEGGDLPTQGESQSLAHFMENASVIVTEQPASGIHRFRYESEGNTAGSIIGENSTEGNKTFPAIQILGCQGYTGNAYVKVTCVNKDPPYRKHPYRLVSKDENTCKKGICIIPINLKNSTVVFKNLGIQRVKKQEIDKANSSKDVLKVVRLKFEVFLQDTQGRYISLKPAYSNPVYNQSKLRICKLSQCTASVAGGQEIILLCEAVAKEDIQVRLFEERDGQVIWEALADFRPEHVHKLVAIVFKTPRYKDVEVNRTVKVQIQLCRPSDSATSPPLPFQLIPLDADPHVLKHKRQQTSGDPLKILKLLMESTSPTSTGVKSKLKMPSTQTNYQRNTIPQSSMKIPLKDEYPHSYMADGYGTNYNFPSDVSTINSTPDISNGTNQSFYRFESPAQESLPSFNNVYDLQDLDNNASRTQNTSSMDGHSNSSYSYTQPGTQASSLGLFNTISSACDRLSQLQHDEISRNFMLNSGINSNWNAISDCNATITNDLNNPRRNSFQLDQISNPKISTWSNSFIPPSNNLENLVPGSNEINNQAQTGDPCAQSNMMFSDNHEVNQSQLLYDQMLNLQNSDWNNFGVQETKIVE